MFRSRTSSQKPGDEFLANFRRQFPELSGSPGDSHEDASGAAAVPTTVAGSSGVGQQITHDRSQSISNEPFKDHDPTPRPSNDHWRLTPSLMDPNGFSFSSFANQPPGYYTPTPGGTNTLFHPQAGDLHTPTLAFGLGLGTPLSMPTTEPSMHANQGVMDMSAFQHVAPAHPPHGAHFHNPFVQAPPPQQAFAPSTFVHQDTGYETMDQDGSPLGSDHVDERMKSMDATFQMQSPATANMQPQQFAMPLTIPTHPSAEKFRYHATLNAPTAMIRLADEIPVTYLNKGQPYSLSIVDTTPSLPVAPGTKFKTSVRISFEDEQQRQKPSVCWGLWKEGRGTSEAHQRGGKLQAVEYVEAASPAESDDKRTKIELDSASFDGFSVIWTPGIHGAVECNFAVRFNFLSTDFSHSKGVKGIPVRLCAKTQVVSDNASDSQNSSEVCFCKVKLFRDHGAERKLSNDVAHVKKTIDKLKQQIAQAESGLKETGKRKRLSGSQIRLESERPGKVQKHKRTWSMSSVSSADGARVPAEEDLHYKLQTLQEMFTSTRPVSVLYLRGEEGDDPDLHPVSLPGEPVDITKAGPRDVAAWRDRTAHGSNAGSLVSPSPSAMSLGSGPQGVPPASQWQDRSAAHAAEQSAVPGSDTLTKIARSDQAGNFTGWIEALGVDGTYRPPVERPPKPVACFYLLRLNSANPSAPRHYKAIYLMQRTLAEFVAQIARKWQLDASRITKTIHVLHRGLDVELDDDVVRELVEGQDMVLEIAEVQPPRAPMKREWDLSIDPAPLVDGHPPQSTYELRLTF